MLEIECYTYEGKFKRVSNSPSVSENSKESILISK